MALIPFPQLITSPTAQSIRQEWVVALISAGIRADLWVPGGGYSTILTYAAQTYAIGMGLVTQGIRGMVLEFSSSPWLPVLAQYMYGVTVNVATFATGPITFVNSGGGTYNVSAYALTLQNPVSGVSYQNTAPFTISPSSTLANVQFAATVAGTVGNSGANTITSFVTPLLGVTATNPQPLAGTNGDSDQTIRQNCQDSLAARSYLGPTGAYRYAIATARNAGLPLNINRVGINLEPDSGFIDVYCASPSGTPTSSDMAAAQSRINAVAEPGGVQATVEAALTTDLATVSPIITVWTTDLVTPNATIKANATNALLTYLGGYPIGGLLRSGQTQGSLFASLVNSQISASNAGIFDVQGSTQDLPLGGNSVPVFTGQINVRQVVN
jgi:uncharacterized phage protein gp47/JayE